MQKYEYGPCQLLTWLCCWFGLLVKLYECSDELYLFQRQTIQKQLFFNYNYNHN